ncbi:MAG: ABC transporter permease [Actinomycetota bacterium]|jgi:branched-subunit amino acid ABC-type transport system permease component
MSEYLPFLVVGLTTGAVYGLAALGLVLTYRTSGVFNLAHGAIAAAGAYLYYQLHVINGWPWPAAMALSLVICGPVMGIAVEAVMRQLVRKQLATIVVGTVGLLLLILGALFVKFGPVNRPFPDFLADVVPGGFTVSTVFVRWAQVVTFGASLAAALALYAVLRFTRTGIAMRAVVDNAELLGLAATNPIRMRRVSWSLGCTFATLSGILLAPKVGLDATLLILLVVYSFGAVAIGRFARLPLTFMGGLVIGLLESLSTKVFTDPPLNGVPPAIPFLVLIVALLVTPARHLPGHIGRSTAIVRERRLRLSPRWSVAGAVTGVAVLLAVPAFAAQRLTLYSTALSYTIMFLSLGLVVRVSGQLSLCHAAFFALGATTFFHLTHDLHLPWLVAVVGAGLVTVPLGVILALPAIRVSGIYLALVTFGFGVLMQNVLFGTWIMWGTHDHAFGARPRLGSLDARNDQTMYFVTLAVALAAVLLVTVVTRCRLGRLLRALADSPLSLTTNGLGVNVTKVLVFCVSAFLAGIAGSLYLVNVQAVTRGAGFGPFDSLTWLGLLVMVSGAGLVPSAFLAGFLLVVAPGYLGGLTVEWQTLIFGAGALVAVLSAETDLSGWLAGREREEKSRSPLQTRRWAAPVAS